MNARRVIPVFFLPLLLFAPLSSKAQLQLPHLSNLCKILDCLSTRSSASPTMPTFTAVGPGPKIQAVFGLITPGARVLVTGSGFGSTAGKLYLSIPNYHYDLKIDSWGNTHIYAAIPEITGISDAPGSLYVVLGQTTSNHWPVNFIATREVVWLDPQKAKIQVLACQDQDVRNNCGSDISGFHTGWVLGTTGGDTFTASVKNGWRFDHVKTDWDGAGFAAVNGFNTSSTSLTLQVAWHYPALSRVDYRVRLYVVGPKGVLYY